MASLCYILIVLVCWGCHNKVPQIQWLKQQKFILPQFWRPEVWNEGVGRSMILLISLGKNPSLPLFNFWLFPTCSCITWIAASVITSLCLCVSLCPYFPLLIRTLVMIEAHPNPAWPHLILITSAKALFPSKAAFTGTKGYQGVQHIFLEDIMEPTIVIKQNNFKVEVYKAIRKFIFIAKFLIYFYSQISFSFSPF